MPTRAIALLAGLGLLCQSAHAGNPNLLFTQLPDAYDTATASPYTALADLNGDGKPDLIRTVPGGSVGVQLGLGSGSFAAGTYYPAGGLPGPLAVADFNNDGKLDVVAANLGTGDNGSLSVLLGNGNGTLQGQMVVNLGFVVRRLLVADYNKDGKADLVAVGYRFGAFPLEGSSVTLPGNGDGTFGTPTFYVNSARTAYADTRDVVVGDFNGDTWPDYLVSNPVGYAIAVFFNNHDGSFTRRAREMWLPGNVASLATGDFNGDGKLDLAINFASDQTYGNTGPGNNVGVVDGNGDGTFGTLRTDVGALDTVSNVRIYSARPAGDTFVRPYSRLLAHDLDGDGKLDLMALAEPGQGLYDVLSILRGAGDGTFNFGAQMVASRNSVWISAADLNQDTAQDLIVTANSSTTQAYLGIPPGGGMTVVTTALDEDNGTPDPNVGTGTSLREAWNQALTQVTPQTINFAANLAGQTVYLTNVGSTVSGPSALRMPPGRNVTVQGLPGNAGITIDGGGVVRPFLLASEFGGEGGTLTLNDLTIQNGRSTYGGGIFNLGNLTMRRCTLTRNSASNQGGALYTGASFVTSARALLINCTIANNTGLNPGIMSDSARLDLLNVTIRGNLSPGGVPNGGGIQVASGSTVTLTNTIVAGNSPRDIDGGNVQANSRYNLIGTAGSGGLVNGVDGNLVGVANVGLAALGNYGGPTPTMALLLDSPARNAGIADPAAPTDQRGVARPQESVPDIGAFELLPAPPQILSDNGATFIMGTSNVFTFVASGSPPSVFTTSTPLPAGVTLSASGILTGNPSTGGVYSLSFTASNGVAPVATQSFTLTVVEAPGLVVNTTNDVASTYDGFTSLREAVAYADTLGGSRTITFAPSLNGQTIPLTTGATGAGDDTALRVNTGNLTIDGGAGVTVRMTLAGRRHLLVAGGAALTLKNLTLAGGDLRGVNDGAAVWNAGSLTIQNCRLTENQANVGGAIWSGGSLWMTTSLVESNSANAHGGAVASSGILDISGCTFARNSSLTEGGAVHCWGYSPSLTVANSTFAENSAVSNGGAIATGANTNTLTHVTIVDNTAPNGAYWQWQTAATLLNTIVARNFNGGTPSDVTSFGTGTLTAASANNLIGSGGSGGLVNGVNGNLVGVSAGSLHLGSLANNGGPTATILPLPGSPALNAGSQAASIATDQRGVLRQALASGGLLGRFYALTSTPPQSLLEPLSNLEALVPKAVALAPRVDFGAGTESLPGDGSVLDRGGSAGNPFGGLGVNVGSENIAALWDGFITVPETADYRFTTRSDDGSVLYLDGAQVVNNNYYQPMANRSGTVRLSAGQHSIRVGYLEAGGEAGIQLSWEQLTGANPFTRQIVPPGVLSSGSAPDIGAVEALPISAPAPLIAPAAGSYNSSVTVSLSTTATDAAIRYTTDGSAPSETHGDVYAGPFTLWASATVKAIATGNGWLASPVTSSSFTIVPALGGWRALQGLPTDGSQDFANPSGDGVINLLKYAFNLAPNAGDLLLSNRTVLPPGGTAGLPAITVDPQHRLVFQFVRRRAATNPGIGYVVEVSSDLSSWSALDLSGATVEPIDGTWERVTITDPTVGAVRFGRVGVSYFGSYQNNFDDGLGAATLHGSAVWTNQAVQLTDALQSQFASVVFDGLTAGPANNGFTARFNLNLGPQGEVVPADGINFAVGDLPNGPWSETGPGTARHLAVGFDTYNNGGAGDIGIHLWANGAHIASNPINPFTEGATVAVEISYDAASGVTVRFNGARVLNNVALPGFSLPAGSRFGIGARTGGSVERAVVDDVEIVTR